MKVQNFAEAELLYRAGENFEGNPMALFVYANKCELISEDEKTAVVCGELDPDPAIREEIYFMFSCFILLYFGEEF